MWFYEQNYKFYFQLHHCDGHTYKKHDIKKRNLSKSGSITPQWGITQLVLATKHPRNLKLMKQNTTLNNFHELAMEYILIYNDIFVKFLLHNFVSSKEVIEYVGIIKSKEEFVLVILCYLRLLLSYFTLSYFQLL
jgi:hypothetical protein